MICRYERTIFKSSDGFCIFLYVTEDQTVPMEARRNSYQSSKKIHFSAIGHHLPETDTVEGALYHIQTIQAETGLKVKGLINNTHLLRETKVEEILKGYRLCKELSDRLGIPITYNTCVEKLVPELEKAKAEQGLDDMVIYPIKLYMRPTWLDRK